MGWLYTLGGLTLVAMVFADSFPPLVGLMLTGTGMILTYATMSVITGLMLAYTEGLYNAAAGTGYFNTVANVGGYFGPVVLGYFSTVTGSYNPGLVILGVLSVVAGIMSFVAPKTAYDR